MKNKPAMAAGLALVLACGTSPARADEVVVIVNKDNPHIVDNQYVARLYTGAIKGWPDGSPAFPVDQMEGSDARAVFYATVVGKSQATMRAIWQQTSSAAMGCRRRSPPPTRR